MKTVGMFYHRITVVIYLISPNWRKYTNSVSPILGLIRPWRTLTGTLARNIILTTIAAICKSVFTLPSSQLDENLPVRSQFYSDHRVNFSTYKSCQSATFGPLTFCIYPLLKSSKKQQCGENESNGVNYEVLSANDRRNL